MSYSGYYSSKNFHITNQCSFNCSNISTGPTGPIGPIGPIGPTGPIGPNFVDFSGNCFGDYMYWGGNTNNWVVGSDNIVLGCNAGKIDQGEYSVAIGKNAGNFNQGTDAIAIGHFAGQNYQPNNSIIINSTGSVLNGITQNACYIKPIRNVYNNKILLYNDIDGEITFSENIFDISVNMYCNLINDVSGIYFCDGTYIGHGNSFHINTNDILHIQSSQNVLIDSVLKLNNDLIFSNNGENIMSFSDFSSIYHLVQLPSIHSQPISLNRISILYDNNISANINSSEYIILPVTNIEKNQLNLSINNNIISSSFDISGQYVEIYLNLEVNSDSNSAEILFDISGVDCTFYETIDRRIINSRLNQNFLTFGPHIFFPEQWLLCTQFILKLTNNSNNHIHISKHKVIFKSYYL